MAGVANFVWVRTKVNSLPNDQAAKMHILFSEMLRASTAEELEKILVAVEEQVATQSGCEDNNLLAEVAQIYVLMASDKMIDLRRQTPL